MSKNTAETDLDKLSDYIRCMQKLLECCICDEQLKTPAKLRCGHIFCKTCIQDLAKYQRAQCPLCKAPIKKRHITKDKHTEKLIHALQRLIAAIQADSGVDITAHKKRPYTARECESPHKYFMPPTNTRPGPYSKTKIPQRDKNEPSTSREQSRPAGPKPTVADDHSLEKVKAWLNTEDFKASLTTQDTEPVPLTERKSSAKPEDVGKSRKSESMIPGNDGDPYPLRVIKGKKQITYKNKKTKTLSKVFTKTVMSTNAVTVRKFFKSKGAANVESVSYVKPKVPVSDGKKPNVPTNSKFDQLLAETSEEQKKQKATKQPGQPDPGSPNWHRLAEFKKESRPKTLKLKTLDISIESKPNAVPLKRPLVKEDVTLSAKERIDINKLNKRQTKDATKNDNSKESKDSFASPPKLSPVPTTRRLSLKKSSNLNESNISPGSPPKLSPPLMKPEERHPNKENHGEPKTLNVSLFQSPNTPARGRFSLIKKDSHEMSRQQVLDSSREAVKLAAVRRRLLSTTTLNDVDKIKEAEATPNANMALQNSTNLSTVANTTLSVSKVFASTTKSSTETVNVPFKKLGMLVKEKTNVKFLWLGSCRPKTQTSQPSSTSTGSAVKGTISMESMDTPLEIQTCDSNQQHTLNDSEEIPLQEPISLQSFKIPSVKTIPTEAIMMSPERDSQLQHLSRESPIRRNFPCSPRFQRSPKPQRSASKLQERKEVHREVKKLLGPVIGKKSKSLHHTNLNAIEEEPFPFGADHSSSMYKELPEPTEPTAKEVTPSKSGRLSKSSDKSRLTTSRIDKPCSAAKTLSDDEEMDFAGCVEKDPRNSTRTEVIEIIPRDQTPSVSSAVEVAAGINEIGSSGKRKYETIQAKTIQSDIGEVVQVDSDSESWIPISKKKKTLSSVEFGSRLSISSRTTEMIEFEKSPSTCKKRGTKRNAPLKSDEEEEETLRRSDNFTNKLQTDKEDDLEDSERSPTHKHKVVRKLKYSEDSHTDCSEKPESNPAKSFKRIRRQETTDDESDCLEVTMTPERTPATVLENNRPVPSQSVVRNPMQSEDLSVVFTSNLPTQTSKRKRNDSDNSLDDDSYVEAILSNWFADLEASSEPSSVEKDGAVVAVSKQIEVLDKSIETAWKSVGHYKIVKSNPRPYDFDNRTTTTENDSTMEDLDLPVLSHTAIYGKRSKGPQKNDVIVGKERRLTLVRPPNVEQRNEDLSHDSVTTEKVEEMKNENRRSTLESSLSDSVDIFPELIRIDMESKASSDDNVEEASTRSPRKSPRLKNARSTGEAAEAEEPEQCSPRMSRLPKDAMTVLILSPEARKCIEEAAVSNLASSQIDHKTPELFPEAPVLSNSSDKENEECSSNDRSLRKVPSFQGKVPQTASTAEAGEATKDSESYSERDSMMDITQEEINLKQVEAALFGSGSRNRVRQKDTEEIERKGIAGVGRAGSSASNKEALAEPMQNPGPHKSSSDEEIVESTPVKEVIKRGRHVSIAAPKSVTIIDITPIPKVDSRFLLTSPHQRETPTTARESFPLYESTPKSSNVTLGKGMLNKSGTERKSELNVCTMKPRPTATTQHRRRICMVGSGLDMRDIDGVMRFARSIRAEYRTTYEPGVTHVIVKSNTANKTLKCLSGIANKNWIVSFKWVTDCMQQGKLLHEEAYEVIDQESGEPGPRRSRLSTNDLFRSFAFATIGPFQYVTVEKIQELLIKTGAEVVQTVDDLAAVQNKLKVFLVENDAHEDEIIGWHQKSRAVPVSMDWAIECISQYNLISMAVYLHELLPDDVLALGFPPHLVEEEELNSTY